MTSSGNVELNEHVNERDIMEPKYPEVEVQLSGEDGNAFAIVGRATKALKDAGHGDEVDAFQDKAFSEDYDALLRTVMEYVTTR